MSSIRLEPAAKRNSMKPDTLHAIIDNSTESLQRSATAHGFACVCGVSNRGARHIIDRIIMLRQNGEDETTLMRRLNPDSIMFKPVSEQDMEW